MTNVELAKAEPGAPDKTPPMKRMNVELVKAKSAEPVEAPPMQTLAKTAAHVTAVVAMVAMDAEATKAAEPVTTAAANAVDTSLGAQNAAKRRCQRARQRLCLVAPCHLVELIRDSCNLV